MTISHFGCIEYIQRFKLFETRGQLEWEALMLVMMYCVLQKIFHRHSCYSATEARIESVTKNTKCQGKAGLFHTKQKTILL
jgi:hypothetical protein